MQIHQTTVNRCLGDTSISLLVEGRDYLPAALERAIWKEGRDTAFAAPELNTIVLTCSLWQKYGVKTPAELAFVLLHEKAHILLGHGRSSEALKEEIEADQYAVNALEGAGYKKALNTAKSVLLKLYKLKGYDHLAIRLSYLSFTGG